MIRLLLITITLLCFITNPVIADQRVLEIPVNSASVDSNHAATVGFLYLHDKDYRPGEKAGVPFLDPDMPVQSGSLQLKFGNITLMDTDGSGRLRGSGNPSRGSRGHVDYSNGAYYVRFSRAETPPTMIHATYTYQDNRTNRDTASAPTVSTASAAPADTASIAPTVSTASAAPAESTVDVAAPEEMPRQQVETYTLVPAVMEVEPIATLTPTTPTPSGPTNMMPSTPRDISSLLAPIVQQYSLPGMAAVIIHDNRITSTGVTGIRKDGRPESLTINDLYHIGSDTKSMTATLLEYVVQNTDVEWTSKVVPLLGLTGQVNAAYNDLTVAQLLQNRGGVPGDADFWTIQKNAGDDLVKARQTLAQTVLSQPPVVTPGTFLYSNVSFIIAGHVAEKVLGSSWETLMQNNLFQPNAMATGGFGAPGTTNVYDQPRGHTSNGIPIEPGNVPGQQAADNAPMLGPAGTVRVTLLDWAKYVNTHLQAARGAEKFDAWQALLGIPGFYKYADFAPLQVPVTEGQVYAMGWTVGLYNGAPSVLYHAGSNTLWYAVVWVDILNDVAVLVVTNQGGDDAAAATNDAIKVLLSQPLN